MSLPYSNNLPPAPTDKIFDVIEKVATDLYNGDEVTYERRDKELRWCWTNQRTKKEYFIMLSQVKRLGSGNMYLTPVMAFIRNEMNAIEAANYINKVPKLKAFL